jgi:hypothetical protein
MRPWDLDTSSSALHRAMEDLQISWQQVGEDWHDSVSQEFCERHLEPLGPAMKMTLDAIARMQHLVNRIQSDCER